MHHRALYRAFEIAPPEGAAAERGSELTRERRTFRPCDSRGHRSGIDLGPGAYPATDLANMNIAGFDGRIAPLQPVRRSGERTFRLDVATNRDIAAACDTPHDASGRPTFRFELVRDRQRTAESCLPAFDLPRGMLVAEIVQPSQVGDRELAQLDTPLAQRPISSQIHRGAGHRRACIRRARRRRPRSSEMNQRIGRFDAQPREGAFGWAAGSNID